MRRKRWALLALILATGAAFWFWNPWEPRQQLLDFSNVNELVAASQEKTREIKNYKYNTEITVGNQIKVSLSNKVVLDDFKRQLIDFSWTAPNMTGKAGMYAEGDSVFLYDPLKDKWALPGEEPSVKPFMDFFWRQVSLADPVENLLKADPKGKNISAFKEDSAESIDTIAVQVIPNEGALSELTKALPPQFAGAELKDVKQIYWISKKDILVSRYEVRAKVAFFGIKTMNFKTSSIPVDYDKTEIKLPQQLVDKMKQSGHSKLQ